MCTVENIGKEEDILSKRMPVDGFIESKDVYLKEHGLYEEWRAIYSKYVNLAQGGDLEALKRALFYAWFQLAEPCWLSGICELPDEETSIVASLLEESLGQGIEDYELAYMLPYYMNVCNYYLERFYPLPGIQRASLENSNVEILGGAREVARNSNAQWKKRGQMGYYWGR